MPTRKFVMNYESLTVDIQSKVAHIQLSRPESLNTQNPDFWREFPDILQEINSAASARAIVISSTGKHFSAGMDIAVFGDLLGGENEQGRYGEQLRRLVLELQQVFTLIEEIRMPVLAAVQGGCIGGAVDMITACDSRYCTEDAFFCVKEIDLGITADLGTLQRLPDLIPQGLARELVYTTRKLPAAEALACGLVNHVFESHEVMLAAVLEIAEQIASKSPLAITGCKSMLNYSRDHSLADSLNHMATWQAGILQPSEMMKCLTAQKMGKIPDFDELSPCKSAISKI